MTGPNRSPARPESAWAELAWDGLGLRVPANFEPVRLGRGYMLLEDESGPRLELRWQPVAKKFSPDRALSHARLVRSAAPGPFLDEIFSLLPDPNMAVACAPVKEPERPCLLRLLPAGRLAVVVGFFPAPKGREVTDREFSPDEARALARVVASLDDSRLQAVSLYDIALRVPEGMALSEFSFELGRFRLLYRDKTRTLEYARFAPARAILAEASLAEWTSRALASWAGRGQAWRETDFAGSQAAGLFPGPDQAGRSLFARLVARLSPKTKPAHGQVWLGDASRILAVRAAGDLSPEAFGAICHEYVVSSSCR